MKLFKYILVFFYEEFSFLADTFIVSNYQTICTEFDISNILRQYPQIWRMIHYIYDQEIHRNDSDDVENWSSKTSKILDYVSREKISC